MYIVYNNLKDKNKNRIKLFGENHPLLFYFLAFTLIPIGLLFAVAISATIIITPIAALFGWF